jgi:ubiquinol-cytochrome c reductase cytochrome c subunit
VYFQVSSGRMPLARQEAQAHRKPTLPIFDPDTEEGQRNLDALGAYIQANGGGPTRPEAQGEALRGGDLARGGELFRLNCASCHNFVGEGGALSSGKSAPSLKNADDLTIYAAMLSGPENMPVFGDNQLTPPQKAAIINYVQTIKAQPDPGGAGIGRIGPVPEGLVIWVVGIGILMFGVFWMGSKA